MPPTKIKVPYNWSPMEHQIPFLDAFETSGRKRFYLIWHRRAGKDLTSLNLLIREAVKKPGLYYYFFPTYTQGKKVIWDGMTNEGRAFLDYIPPSILIEKNIQELKLKLWNGSIIQIIGTDNYDAVRGTNPLGCVFSEYAYQTPMAWEVIAPILRLNGGWAVFNTTPNGHNHAYDLWEVATKAEHWWTQVLSITDTNMLTDKDLDAERAEGKSEEMIQQEYYCSFEIGALGAFYTEQLRKMKHENRICAVPYEPQKRVELFLDLGRDDLTTILFVQTLGKEVRIIDTYANRNFAVDHYVKVLRDKDYFYGDMWIPHDGWAKRMESNLSIGEQFRDAGFTVQRVPDTTILNGVQICRKLFPKLWFDKEKTRDLVKALENYHREYDEVKKMFSESPKHDWSSHFSDAFRYCCVVQEGLINNDVASLSSESMRFVKQSLLQQMGEARGRDSLDVLDSQMDMGRNSYIRFLSSASGKTPPGY